MCSSVVLPAPFGPSSPVTPGPTRERDVVDGHDVAVPARDVFEHDRGRGRAGGLRRAARAARTSRGVARRGDGHAAIPGSADAGADGEPSDPTTAAAEVHPAGRSSAANAGLSGIDAEEPRVRAVEDVAGAQQHGEPAMSPIGESDDERRRRSGG